MPNTRRKKVKGGSNNSTSYAKSKEQSITVLIDGTNCDEDGYKKIDAVLPINIGDGDKVLQVENIDVENGNVNETNCPSTTAVENQEQNHHQKNLNGVIMNAMSSIDFTNELKQNNNNRVSFLTNPDADADASRRDSDIISGRQQERENHLNINSIAKKCLRTIGVGKYYDVNQNGDYMLIEYLHWTFRASFMTLFLAFIAKFMILVIVFSGFIALASALKPSCITPSAKSYADIFALSWTTFTTVGYGSIYPSLSDQSENGHCSFIVFLTSMEAFIGVLFAGFSSAIIFGKVLRIQSQAQVRFSEPIVVRYGQGVQNGPSSRNRHNTNTPETDQIACPILEFRIVNRLYSKPGCEIVDANLNCMVLKTEAHGDTSTYNHSNAAESAPGVSLLNTNTCEVENFLDVNYCVHKLELEMPQHAFFKRLWTARHVMDGYSPILTSRARKLVRRNGGFWPKELNTHEGVKDSIQFDQIIVNLSGTSNISAASVYSQKIYNERSMQLGARFLNIVYKHEDTGKMMLEINDIDNITDQCY